MFEYVKKSAGLQFCTIMCGCNLFLLLKNYKTTKIYRKTAKTMVKNNDKKLNIYVKRTIDGGVKPIEILLFPVYDLNYGEIKAYKAELVIKSVVAGSLAPSDYFNFADEKLLNKLALRAVKKSAETVFTLEKSGVKTQALFIKIPASFIYFHNIFGALKNELDRVKSENGGDFNEKQIAKICLTFDEQATFADGNTLKSAISDIKSAGLRVAFCGYGGENFAIEKLINACPDYVFTSKTFAELCENRDKFAAVAPLINFVKSLGGEAVAENIQTDDELREFRARDCFGFIPSENYSGRLPAKNVSFTVENAIKNEKELNGDLWQGATDFSEGGAND